MRPVWSVWTIAASMAATGTVTFLHLRLGVINPTTIALSYLVVVLVIAGSWGIVESTVAALTAILCFNFFFLPPVGTLTIADPQNWIALIAFMITAVVVSQLSGRAPPAHARSAVQTRRSRTALRAEPFAAAVAKRRGCSVGDRACHCRSVPVARRRPLRSSVRFDSLGRAGGAAGARE